MSQEGQYLLDPVSSMGHQQVEVGGHPLEWGHVLHGLQITQS